MRWPLAVLGLLLAGCAGPQPVRLPEFGVGERPNVLIVLVDVLRRDHLGVYGYPLPTSPNLDAFATLSFRFDSAYSHSTWTKPSVATLFTSVYADQHGLGRVGFEDDAGFHTEVLSLELETLAERFQQAGYRTGSFGANVHIQRKTGFSQGFEHFYMKRLDTAFRLNRLLERWLDNPEAEAPFFAYLHYMDAHWPYTRKLPDESGRFGNTRFARRPPETWTAVPAWMEKHLNDASLAAIIARYDQEIAFIDAAFGELVAGLGERGLLDDTVILFVADHGEGLNEHGELQHSFAPYPEVTEVPLLVYLPPVYGIAPGASAATVGLVDVMPTLLDLVGIEVPDYAQGRSLVPILLGEERSERPAYSDGAGVRALRGAGHALFVDAEGERTCYDRSVDPGELTPLTGDELPQSCRRLAGALDNLVARFESHAQQGGSNATVELDAEEIEVLRALGYLD